MDGNALVNMLKDRRILVIILAVIVIVAAVGAYMLLKDDGGSSGPTEDLIIGENQTRDITEDLTVAGNITVSAGGTLNIADDVTVTLTSPSATIDVAGTLNSNGTIEFVRVAEDGTQEIVYSNQSGESRSIESTGTMMITLENFHSSSEWGGTTYESGINGFINGAIYSAVGTEVTITTLNSAVNADQILGNTVYLTGTFTDSDASVPADIEVVVNEGATVTLGTITLAGGASFDAIEGTTTATFSASGSTGISSGNGVMFYGKTNGDSTLLVMEGDATGSLTVKTGSVYVDDLTVENTGSSLAVAEGAILVLRNIADVCNGRLITIDNPTSPLVTVSGIVVIGDKPSGTEPVQGTAGIDGSFSTAGLGYVKVYAGAQEMTDTGTTFHVNGSEYMTVFGNIAVATVLAGENVEITGISQSDFGDVTKWNVKESCLGDSLNAQSVVGSSLPDVYFSNQKVSITISNTDGISFTIDGATIGGTVQTISVAPGTYTFTITGGTAKLGETDIANEIVVPSGSTTGLTLTITAANPQTGGETAEEV